MEREEGSIPSGGNRKSTKAEQREHVAETGVKASAMHTSAVECSSVRDGGSAEMLLPSRAPRKPLFLPQRCSSTGLR